MKASLLAFAVVAGAILPAMAAATTTYRAYDLNVSYNNNNDAKIWSVNGGPQNPPDGVYPRFFYAGGTISTDASGKISGVGQWVVTYGASGTPFSIFYGTVSGKLTGKIGIPASVTMTVRADGYTADGLGFSTPFKGSFKFTGKVGVNPVNANDQVMVGTLSGTAFGSTPADPKSFKVNDRAAYIDDSGFRYVRINAEVLQSNRGTMKLFSTSLQGNGSIKNSSTYRAKVTGAGFSRGIAVSLSGSMGTYASNVGTNPVSFLAPATAEIGKGSKWNGQAIQGAAFSIGADLIY